MASRHIGLPPGLTEQPGRKFTVSAEGIVTITTRYRCNADEIERLLPPPNTTHPQFGFALLHEITGVSEEGDQGIIEAIYKGLSPNISSAEGGVRYSLVASTREEPLPTHPRYKDIPEEQLRMIQQHIQNPDPAVSPALTDTFAIELYSKMLKGQTSYLCSALVWREDSAASSGWTSTADVGKIDQPAGSPPSLGSGGNWLLSSMEQEKQGGAFKRSREWIASGPGGWDAEVYG